MVKFHFNGRYRYLFCWIVLWSLESDLRDEKKPDPVPQKMHEYIDRAVDPHTFFADLDPAAFLNEDPDHDPADFFNADPDPV